MNLLNPTSDVIGLHPANGAVALVIEDSAALRRSTVMMLESTGMFRRVLSAEDGLSGLSMLRANPVDIVLCDMHMPHCDGPKFLQLRSQVAELAAIPVLMLTGDDMMDHKIRALTSGACDYISKPVAEAELRARVGVHLRLKRAGDELRHKTEQLEQLAQTDPLTGIANRRRFDEALELEFERSKRYGRPFSLVFLDLDHFQRFNDAYGHLAGDKALRTVGAILAQNVRRNDLAARYSGARFSLILPETSLRDAALAAERLRSAIASRRLSWEGEDLSITASMGVASLPTPKVSGVRQLVQLADSALHRAKSRGRNCVGLPSVDPDTRYQVIVGAAG